MERAIDGEQIGLRLGLDMVRSLILSMVSLSTGSVVGLEGSKVSIARLFSSSSRSGSQL